MKPDWKKFQEKYKQVSPEIRALIDSDKISILAIKIFNTHKEKYGKIQDIVIVLSNYILEIINIEELKKEMNLPDEECVSLLKEIDTLKKNQVDKKIVPEAPKEIRERLDLRPENRVATNQIENEHTAVHHPLTREEVLKVVSPTRTLAGDVATLKGNAGGPTVGYENTVPQKED